MLINSYDGLSEKEIRKLSHEELVQAVLRIFRVKEIKSQDYLGYAYLSDDLADAFRGRI